MGSDGCYIKGPKDAQFAKSWQKGAVCSCICHGVAHAKTSKSGSKLKQMTTSNCIRCFPDKWQIYAEVAFDMTIYPPEPIYRTGKNEHILSRFFVEDGGGGPVNALKSKIKNDIFHPEHRNIDINGNYKYRNGSVRIPDVIVTHKMEQFANSPYEAKLRDVNGKYVGPDHLKFVVEIKIGDDKYDRDKMLDYDLIAGGGEERAVLLRSEECNCEEEQKQSARVPVPERKKVQQRQSAGDAIYDVAVGAGIAVAGAALTSLSTAFGAILLADDATGVGVADDGLLPVAGAGIAAGTNLEAQGAKRAARGILVFLGAQAAFAN